MKIVGFVFSFFIAELIFAQTDPVLMALKDTFKGESKIVLLDEVVYKIDIKNGELLVVKNEINRSFYTDNRAQAYAEDQITTSDFKSLESIEVYSEIPDGKKYKKIKTNEITEKRLIDEDIFYDDVKTHVFVYPQLRENAISNLKCEYIEKEPRLISGQFFQHFYPYAKVRLVIDADENVNIGFAKFNTDAVQIDSSFQHKKGRNLITFEAENIKGIRYEDNMPPIRYVVPHIVPYIKSYTCEGEKKPVLQSIEDLYRWNHSLLNTSCSPDSALIAMSKELTAPFENEEDKVKAIFKWVQKNIHYVAIEVGLGGFVPECAGLVYKNKYGDCKGMANILHNMLDAVGIQSHLTLIGTGDLPYTYDEIPSPLVDNHMILTYIDPKGDYIFLDATNHLVPFGVPSSFTQGKEALIFFDDHYEIKKVPIIKAELNQQQDSIKMEIAGNNLVGKGKIDFKGYYYEIVKNRTESLADETKRIKFINGYVERGNNKFVVKKASEKVDDEQHVLTYLYDFEIGSYVQLAAENIYVNMNIFKSILHDKIKADHPYLMRFGMENSYRYVFELKIPEGYVVDYLPQNEHYKNEYYQLDIEYEKKDNAIIYHLYASYSTLQLDKDQFYLINDFLDVVKKNYREVVSLKKK